MGEFELNYFYINIYKLCIDYFLMKQRTYVTLEQLDKEKRIHYGESADVERYLRIYGKEISVSPREINFSLEVRRGHIRNFYHLYPDRAIEGVVGNFVSCIYESAVRWEDVSRFENFIIYFYPKGEEKKEGFEISMVRNEDIENCVSYSSFCTQFSNG